MRTNPSFKTWTETPDTVLEKVKKALPYLEDFYKIGHGKLSKFKDEKRHRQLGFVFPLTFTLDGNNKECIVYYPEKGEMVHYTSSLPHSAVRRRSTFSTKHGLMQVLQFNREMVVVMTVQRQILLTSKKTRS